MLYKRVRMAGCSSHHIWARIQEIDCICLLTIDKVQGSAPFNQAYKALVNQIVALSTELMWGTPFLAASSVSPLSRVSCSQH